MKKSLLLFLMVASYPVLAQKKVEMGVFGDFVNLNQLKNQDKNIASYKIASPPLSVGAYVSLYPYKFLGLQIGIQYVSAANGSVTYNSISSPQIGDKTFTYHYQSIRIPVALTGDLGKWVYYCAGVNLSIDQSTIDNKAVHKDLVSGIGMQGEAGIHRSLFTSHVKVRLGFTVMSERTFTVNEESIKMMDWGLRLRLGLSI